MSNKRYAIAFFALSAIDLAVFIWQAICGNAERGAGAIVPFILCGIAGVVALLDKE